MAELLLSLKKLFHCMTISTGKHFRIFWDSFWGIWYVPLFLESCSIFSCKILNKCTNSVQSQHQKNWQYLHLCMGAFWGFSFIFGGYVSLHGPFSEFLGAILGSFFDNLWALQLFLMKFCKDILAITMVF